MNISSVEMLEYIGGVPFLDEGFQARRLVTAVACLRRNLDPQAYTDLRDYLEPVNARSLYKRHATCSIPEFPNLALSPSERQRVVEAVADVLAACPSWEPLFSVPIRYLKLIHDGISSVTSVLIPQTIFLGEIAFRDHGTLVELVIHEHAHVWLNFIAELKDLQTPNSLPEYTLPSGTSGKTLRGVLLAAHFAAAVVTYLRVCGEKGLAGANPDRAAELEHYLAGCIKTATGRPDLTEMGCLTLARLQSVCAVENGLSLALAEGIISQDS